MAAGQQGALNALARAGEIDAATAYRSGPAFLAQQLRAAELLGQASGELGQSAGGAGGINVNLQIVIPRALEQAQPEQLPAIDVQAIGPSKEE